MTEKKPEILVAVQIISKILTSGSLSIVEDNQLEPEYFIGYENEIEYIIEHQREYGNVPDTITFLSKFTDFDLLDVTESDRYLVNKINEEYLYFKSVPVIQKAAELLKTDSNAALDYWKSAMRDLQPNYDFGGVDIIKNAKDRYLQYEERRDRQDSWFFESGFKELDEITHGIQREEELVVIVARTNQGKSWVLEKIITHIWQTGFNVGFISPEMSATSIGFRFDTLFKGISNKDLMWGAQSVDKDSYKSYIDELSKNDKKFLVASPTDFRGQLTVSKLKTWVIQNKLDAVAIDGITYMSDERYRRGDSKTISLTNISEDLMNLSVEVKIPIIVVVQANRSGVVDKDKDSGTPELESIRDSDGIAMNASKVLSIRQKADHTLEIGIKKQRFGRVGDRLCYSWDIDTGVFTHIDTPEDGTAVAPRERKKKSESDTSEVRF